MTADRITRALSRVVSAMLHAVGVLVGRSRGPERRHIVLGAELAAARRREQPRLMAGPCEPSPLAGWGYVFESGEYDLMNVREGPVDARLHQIVRTFLEQPADRRDQVRARLDLDELSTLVQFAKRCAVLALNESPADWLQDGLMALAMIDEARIDPRDVAWATALLSHAGWSNGSPWPLLVGTAADAATPGMAALLRACAGPAVLTEWGYTQVCIDGRHGLMKWGGAQWRPSVDLQALALRLVAHVDITRYVAQAELASPVSEVWFADARAAARILRRRHAAVLVAGVPKPAVSDDWCDHAFRQWVVDLPSAADASALVACTRASQEDEGEFSVAFAVGRFFSLISARSQVEGLAPIETAESVQAFVERARAVMVECVEGTARAE